MNEDAYARDRQLVHEFLQTFTLSEGESLFYRLAMQDIVDLRSHSLEIELEHLKRFSEESEDREQLFEMIKKNCKRYLSLFAEEIDKIMESMVSNGQQIVEDELHAVLQHSRDDATEQTEAYANIPKALRRKYEIFFKPLLKSAPLKMRDIRAKMIGNYVTFRGMCTRITDVKPLIEVACYTCETCGHVYFQEVDSNEFNPKQYCQSRTCESKTALFIETRASKFTKYQEIKVQEMSEDVPIGHIPRSMTVILKGDMTRRLSPGDVVDISGIFLPRLSSGYKSTSSLVSTTYLEAMSVRPHKTQYFELEETPEMISRLEHLRRNSDVYEYLAKSIAPEIYGHIEVKKALLLLLCGGVTRSLEDGVKIRGDIHVCLMGDPGVAKSQLLKHIVSIAPRGVYTTGRGSSGVGLTASIQRDGITGEMILEGGALVLADKGICCIDEFDKMQESDRTAIHEVMEQQTVSIAKAGITTTLNARTTVLAAANPAFGRYNISATPQENINLPAALLSRFDLMWLILDTPDQDADTELARHVMNVHREGRPPASAFTPVSAAELRAYISVARKFHPYVPEDLTDNIAGAYAGMRRNEEKAGHEATGYTTARTLLSIIRLAEALARLRWANVVTGHDVEQALNLMKMSKASLELHTAKSDTRQDPVTTLYLLLRRWSEENEAQHVPYMIATRIATKANLLDILSICLAEYAALDIWILDDENNATFVD
mmetsp:Transcript_2871/g.10377  ORF Transcript_2871/g.10377 Transcript_2871/m.10377 type:complete len:718 (-) Transcript_2871:2392-4545(-)|eukprot:CAMPEP_0174577806 /NCGR_PEP_ID=MMETSP0929-20130131/216_1 /TAXON_ID=548131 ORGANISM="Ostreococcus mediterraneus, Strain clade-D-RCC2572" /NCGR_SAMPLE_ID=MMETSP0929 /ASSEMBLY_ACC=CAM_ASM_000573 /LENGTH=717 /DNA_ID=CAMNT_0015758685 /DNA_START=2381 /DNA_END=4534 /DNA_ORIENTATION=+